MKQTILILLVLLILSVAGKAQDSTFTIPVGTWLRADSTFRGSSPTFILQKEETKVRLRSQQDGYAITVPANEKVQRVIKLEFNLTTDDASYIDFREYFLSKFTGDAKTYDCWIAQYAFQPYRATKVIDVSVTWRGVTTEYTFEEFKKYLWP